MEIKHLPLPKRFLIQLHITNKCNLRCKHCSQASGEASEDELNTKQFLNVLKDYFRILKLWNIKGHINISGGEPFTRKDLPILLKEIYKHRHLTECSILTNGLLITEDIAKRLKKFQPAYVQVSLEGMKHVNDLIRGEGTFEKIINSIRILLNEGVRTYISFTAHKNNYKEFPRIVELGKQLGVEKVWTERLCPCGRSVNMKEEMLEPAELKKFYYSNYKISKKLSEEKSKTSAPLVRSLCYLVDKNNEYICSAGTILVVMPNGDVFPCTRLPILVGNLTKQTFFEIWYSSNLLWKLRDKNETHHICRNCAYFEHCEGGARCISYAYFGTPFAPDPQCWAAFKKLPPRNKIKKVGNGGQVKFSKTILVPEKQNNAVKCWSMRDTGYLYLNIGISKKELDSIAEKILNDKTKTVTVSFNLSDNHLNKVNGENIMIFLNKLEEGGVNFKVAKPLPRCLFGLEYKNITKKFNIPRNCLECSELFTIKDQRIQTCKTVNKRGPSIKYLNNRYQIYEYFNYFHEKLNPGQHCSKCRYYLRKTCDCLCFKE